ncbi:MAG: hypothetical protein A3G76_12585 [Acidobacteria bacterium RIFCSPLOWO2_12_FULL_65_11]|nr:MAG: hypothetical protein A3H95_13890 [Acidobacteria bacterium RIFCSPLOWO2_02_FULL_64_15]OFW34406.1 MAG: hypothetical protein A3G76_12585 [Acidobacteria bacterium RIFCSPLOWO2_12_FULL_65_11]
MPALLLALDLERRGFSQSLDSDRQYQVEATSTSGQLTDVDLLGIHRWRLHLGAIVSYQCEVCA